MDWGGLATAAWKKGGALACGAGGAAGGVHSATGRAAGAGDAVQPLSAPWGGDGGGVGATCRCTDGASRGRGPARPERREPLNRLRVSAGAGEWVVGGGGAGAAGCGGVGKGGALGGLLWHPVLAGEAGTGALLGLVWMQVWTRAAGAVTPRRQRATAAKESQRWLDGARQA